MPQQSFQQHEGEEPLPLSNEAAFTYQGQFDPYNAQKLTPPQEANTPTAQQCQIMAFVSIGLWALAFIFATGIAVYVKLWLTADAIMVFCLFLFMILLVAINSAFNRGRAVQPSENPTSEQRIKLTMTSLIAWLLVALGIVGFIISPIEHWEKFDVGIFLLCGLALFTFLLAALNMSFNRSRPAR